MEAPEPVLRFDRPDPNGAWIWTGDYVPRWKPRTFSTRIEDAWRVVEKVNSPGNFYFHEFDSLDGNRYCAATFGIVGARSHSPSLAICRAAILATQQASSA